MKSKLTNCSNFTAFLTLLLMATTSSGQTAAPRRADSETVQLSPFQVSAESVTGYAASETMSGSRVKTPIIDLPYSVNVLTNDFTKDFGLFELSDNITHVGNFTGLDIGGNFMLRGFNSSNQLRDGFFRLGRYGSSNIDRIEIIKGSNAAIYGRTSAGGMINMISKQPKPTASEEIAFNYGDYGTQRVTLEVGGPLFASTLGKTSYVFSGSLYQKEFDMAYARNRNQEFYVAAKHVFNDGGGLLVSAELFHQTRHSPSSAIPMITDQKGTASTADDTVIGYADNLGKYNSAGPNSELNRGNNGVTVVYDRKLSAIFSARVSGNISAARRWDFNFNQGWGAVIVNAPNAANSYTTARGAVPTRGRIYEDTGGFQGDLLATYKTSGGKVEHRTLFTVDINDYYRYDPTRQWSAATDPTIVAWSALRTVRLDSDFRPISAIGYFPKTNKETPGEIATRNTKRRTSVVGASLREQAAMFDGRLLAYAGARYDSILYRHRDFLTPAASFVSATGTPFIPGYAVGQLIRRSLNQFKPNVGVNYKVTPTFRTFVNYSQSWFVNQGDNPIDVADPTYQTETAGGYDYGFKGSLLGDRLNYTVCGFYATRQNVSVTGLKEQPAGSGTFITVTERNGDQRVRGVEADVSWMISKELSALASYGTVDSIYTDFGAAAPAAIGRKVQFVAPHNGSVSLKYAPLTGRLKGFSTNLGYTFVGATPTEAPNAGDTYATQAGGKRVVASSTGQWALKAPAYGLWNLGVRYRLASGPNYAHTLAFNINNVTDEKFFRAGSGGANSRYIGDHRAFYLTYTLSHKGAKF